jgi:hypothetical protein
MMVWLGAHVVPELPAVLLLTAFTVTLHSVHLLDTVEGWLMNVVVTRLHQAGSDQGSMARANANERVLVLEAGPRMRVRELESSRVTDHEHLARVGGVVPIDRAKFAATLNTLATRLRAIDDVDVTPEGARVRAMRVVAIDVDITPLGDTSEDDVAQTEMANALEHLRQRANVVAVVYSRDTEAQRRVRNTFMVTKAKCTRSCGRPPEGGPPGALYFASPRVFQSLRHVPSFPLAFPFKSTAKSGAVVDALHPVPGYFPSISNLVHLSSSGAERDEPAQRALTAFCEQAASARHQHRLTEDLIAESALGAGHDSGAPTSRFKLRDYKLRGTNWPLQDTDLLSRTELESRCQLVPCARSPSDTSVSDELLRAGVLIVGIDGGDRHDKFDVPSASADPMSGPMLHGLQALSARSGKDLDSHSVWGTFVDLAAGALFVVAWELARAPLRRLRRFSAAIGHPLDMLAPLLIAGAIGYLCVSHVSPWLMALGYWVNPAYVLLGLALHAHVSAAHGQHAQGHVGSVDMTFGLQPLVRTWREAPEAGVLGNALVSFALRWSLLIVSVVASFYEQDELTHWPIFLVAVIAIGFYVQSRYGGEHG